MPRIGNTDLGSASRITNLPSATANGHPMVFQQIPALYRSGTDITAAVNQLAPGTVAQVANTLRASPLWIRKTVTFVAFRLEVTTLVAATTCRLGLYTDNGSGYPSTLVTNSDVGTIDTATTGVKTSTFSSAITLTPGLYWIAWNSNGAATVRSIAVGAIDSTLGSNPAGGATSTYTAWTVALTYGALPSTFTGGGTLLTNTAIPRAMLRVQ